MLPPDQAEKVVSRVVDRLREIREDIGLSKNRLAKLAGVDPKTVAFVEKRQRNPTLFTLLLLAGAMEADLGEIVKDALHHEK